MFISDTKCKGCNRTNMIQNKHYHLCSECIYKMNHEGKNRIQVSRERAKDKNNNKSQKDVFLEIWSEREHICVKCGKRLNDVPLASYFSHIRSKGSCPELKYDKSNIELLCCECHYEHEFKGK